VESPSTLVASVAVRFFQHLPPAFMTEVFDIPQFHLADTAFGSVEWLQAMRQRRHSVIVGVRCDRKLANGRQVCHLDKKGKQVRLDGLAFPVTLS
jgi:hypothetical protein